MNQEKCLGIDVSKDNITCHILTEYPTGGVAAYWSKTRLRESVYYPKFYNKKQRSCKDCWDFVEYLRKEKPTCAILEPTGVHYSKLWAKIIEALGIPVYWIGHIELKRHRQQKSLKGHTKTDAVDALAMASYWFDAENRLIDGSINLSKFLTPQPESIMKLRELVCYQEHLIKIQSPTINYMRQLLSWQYPEMSKSESIKFFEWLADESLVSEKVRKTKIQKYEASIAYGLGIDIDPHLRFHSFLHLEEMKEEQRIMTEIREILELPEFAKYIEIFDLFGFGDKIKAKILSRIYPFENYLLNGKEFIEYERRETKKENKTFQDGCTFVQFEKGAIKRVKRNRSRDSFKMRLGFGTILEMSGDKWKMIKHGSKLTRKSCFQFVLSAIQPDKITLPDNKIIQELYSWELELQEKETLGGKHIQYKIASKVVNLLYREFAKRFTTR